MQFTVVSKSNFGSKIIIDRLQNYTDVYHSYIAGNKLLCYKKIGILPKFAMIALHLN